MQKLDKWVMVDGLNRYSSIGSSVISSNLYELELENFLLPGNIVINDQSLWKSFN